MRLCLLNHLVVLVTRLVVNFTSVVDLPWRMVSSVLRPPVRTHTKTVVLLFDLLSTVEVTALSLVDLRIPQSITVKSAWLHCKTALHRASHLWLGVLVSAGTVARLR